GRARVLRRWPDDGRGSAVLRDRDGVEQPRLRLGLPARDDHRDAADGPDRVLGNLAGFLLDRRVVGSSQRGTGGDRRGPGDVPSGHDSESYRPLAPSWTDRPGPKNRAT